MCDPVSNYAVGSAGMYFRIYGHVGTVAAALLAVEFALSRTPGIPGVAVISMVLLVVFRIGVVLVPTDRPGDSASAASRLHLLLAIATFAATYTTIANALPALSAVAPIWLAAVLSTVRFAAMLSLAGVVVTMLPSLKRVFGLAERAFLLSTMLWFVAANIEFFLAAGAT